VAGGLVPLSIGTDTGGSVRLPAAYCGITGFKFTVDAVDTTGVAPLSKTLDSIGVFAKSMAETAMVYDALVDDPQRAIATHAFTQQSARAFIQGLRIGRIAPHELTDVQPDIVKAYEATLEFFKSIGACITTLELPCAIADLAPLAINIMVTEGAASYGNLANDLTKPMDSGIRPRLQAGAKLLAIDYIAALENQTKLKEQFAKVLEHIDIFATPTGLTTAVPLAEVNPSAPPVHFTRVLNVLDMCGVSVPVGLDAQHLPIGFQLGAAVGRDAFLIEVACAFQALTQFHLVSPKAKG
jgi:aspartyl-tRNA(Asn)/glutamyl-tRNA(Gln) amidotransferase subunit A